MKLRKAINDMCKSCTYDERDVGTAAQQIACCTSKSCPLHPVRPITATKIPKSLLRTYRIYAEQLDDRARALLVSDSTASGDTHNGTPADMASQAVGLDGSATMFPVGGQNEPLLDAESIDEPGVGATM